MDVCSNFHDHQNRQCSHDCLGTLHAPKPEKHELWFYNPKHESFRVIMPFPISYNPVVQSTVFRLPQCLRTVNYETRTCKVNCESQPTRMFYITNGYCCTALRTLSEVLYPSLYYILLVVPRVAIKTAVDLVQ